MLPLAILLLGEPRQLAGDEPVKVPRRKSRALLYYLAAHERPVSREHLLGLFWPDLDRVSAQQTLRTTLHSLRQALGRWLVVEEHSLALGPEVLVDLRRFVAGVQAPDLESLRAALELYRGELLAGFSLPDVEEYNSWVDGERERARQLMLRGLARLAQLYEQRRDLGAALATIERAVAFDPLQEEHQRAAMRLLYLSGDRAGAIRRYESLGRLLDDELGVPPMAETRALYDGIITDALPAPVELVAGGAEPPAPARLAPALPLALAPATLPFSGRDRELETLGRLFAERSGALALLEGEPGIGKTRLAAEFLRRSGASALVGTARELEHAIPYHPLVDALRGLTQSAGWPETRVALQAALPPLWLGEAARLLPELHPSPPQVADEPRLWEGVNRLLQALASQRPLVVFLDDLQWADASTLALLGYLVRQSGGAIFYLAAARPHAPGSRLATLLQALTREGRLERLPLARLDAGAVEAIARSLEGASAVGPSPEVLGQWLARASEGNPYVLAELLRHARASGALDPVSAAPVVPPTIYSLVQSRLARLSDPARRLLDVAVVVGRVFAFELVQRASGLGEGETLDALDELRAAGLVQPLDGMRYAFDHSMTLEVAWADVGEARHRLLHRRVAEALEALHARDLDSVAGVIAWHYGEGHDPQRAAPYALRAAEQAGALAAWQEAVAFYEQALAAELDDDQRFAALMALGHARVRAGLGAQASEAFRGAAEEARARGDADGSSQALLALAQSFIPQARYAEAIQLLRQLAPPSEGCSARMRARAEQLWGTLLAVEGSDLASALEHLQRAEQLSDDPGAGVEPLSPQRQQLHFDQAGVLAQQGKLEQAIAGYRKVLDLARRSSHPDSVSWVALAHNNLAYHLHLLGDPAALGHARAGLELAREKGVLGFQSYLLSTLGEILLAQGEVEDAARAFEEGLALAERFALPERIAGLTANLGRVALRQGETALAVHRLSTALAQADALGTRHLAAQIRIWLAPLLPPAERRARLAEARAIAEAGGRTLLLRQIEGLAGRG